MKRENDENNNLKQPYLSGAYIRTFVKQLASSTSMRDKQADPPPPPPPTEKNIPHKKQVRRRLQTRKPYQEKLLNMAEARREIVTALKLHRAAMKQQNQQIQPQPDQKSRRNPRIYASIADANFAQGNSPYYFSSCPAPPPPPPPPPFLENLDLALPSQALGLNLNLHDFITASSSSIYSSSSPSTSSSPPPPAAAAAETGRGFEFLNCVEIGGEDEREEEVVSSPFDEVMEFPAWLNANESCLQHVDHFCAQDSVLPCMDIEEIEGMDGDWLA
ncbi:formin-like protein 20 [Salvia miltiorrhiza]|uniref:formin-like protein 20 n=1 Tax=Salvia miltiorrhiza TaxID=226208 RepID=UPI0025AD1782|nr:formin-like protein 20 [Salvia miltiorrhiza]